MTKTYHGSCHCGAVQFEADIELSAGTNKCNCSICRKRRNWNIIIKPEQFRLLAGADALGDYQFGSGSAHHLFCTTCGCAPFSKGHVPEIGGDFVGITLASLDDVELSELASAPVRYMDGRANNWFEEPADKAIL